MIVTFVHPVRHTIIKDARDAIKCDAFLLSFEGARRTVINVVIQYEHKRVAHRSKAYQLQQSARSHWRVISVHAQVDTFCLLHWLRYICVYVCVYIYIYIYIYIYGQLRSI